MYSPAAVPESGPIKVLYVEDDERLARLTTTFLESREFLVTQARTSAEAMAEASRRQFDVVLLDVMLPGVDGVEVCRWLRQRADVPIIMISARREDADKVLGLESGADDYLTKPFSPRELLARIRAVLRRAQATPVPAVPGVPEQTLRFGRCELDPMARTLARDGQVHRLTSGEFALLSALVRHPRVPLTRDRLISLARGRDSDPFERSVDVAISKLRRLIEDDPKAPRHIQTVWGHGYVFVPD